MSTEKIAKIESTFLGYEDHGILTGWLHVTYGGSGQGIGGLGLDDRAEIGHDRGPHLACGWWIAGVLRACGVDSWEQVAGRTVMVEFDNERWGARPIAIRPLPTEPGSRFSLNYEVPA